MTYYYAYFRVSTTQQDIGRQVDALNKWKKENNINILEENIYTDYYTGKTFDRENYQLLKSKLKSGDYLIIKEVDRLGRNWDGIKKEWQELKDQGINIIIIDMPILSDSLPSERPAIEGLDLRLIKEQILSLMCYSAQKEREKISQRTKEALSEKKKNGTKTGNPIGRPKSKTNTKENFINTLQYMIDNKVGQKKALFITDFPIISFKRQIKKCYDKYNTKDYSEIINKLKEDLTEWGLF